MKKTIISTGVFAVVLLFGLGIIDGPIYAAGQQETEQVTLNVLGWQPGGAEAWNEVVRLFEEEHPNIKIELEVVPMEGYYTKQGAYISSESGPDIMGNNVGFETWERRTGYIDLTDRLASEPQNHLIDTQSFHLGFDESQPIYGLGFGFQGNIMYYNRRILEDAGLDPDNPPQTWDEFQAAAEAIQAIGKAPIATGVGHTVAYWIFPEIAKNFFDGPEQISEFARGELNWDGPILSETLRYMKDMVDRGWFQEGAGSINMQPDGFDYFVREEAAFTPSIISDAFHWKAAGEAIGHENVGAMLWPSVRPDAPFARSFSGVPNAQFGITPWSEHKDEAWEFLKFIVSPEVADVWLELGGVQPNTTQFDQSEMSHSPAFLQIQEIIKNSMGHTGVLNGGREVDELSRGYQEVMLGQLSLPDWTSRLERALDQSELKNPNHQMWQ